MANPNAGRFVWHEIMSKDIGAALKFYTAMFGWTVSEMDMGPAGKYHMLMKGKDIPIGGGMQTPAGVPSHWMTSIGTENTDATATKITELGGKILVPPTTVPDMVRFAVATDPQGAAFGVAQGMGPGADMAPYEGSPRPGTFCWDELHTSDLDGAQKFYSALFGWTGKMGEGEMKYWHWQNAGKDIGGMMKLMMPNVPPNWLPYIAVVDVDAETKKTKDLGGKVMMEPMDIEKVGKFSVVQDPTGATFALFRSARV
ncbi:MAG: Glyoxalase-like domain protein [Myxococcaceae bacterium]|nr:Glyoxalase-like domain protein [Myxococcaceae bacterium]